ncbi:hypothetical protein KUCAC02_026335, partial [Chaenocephalus aceratus]
RRTDRWPLALFHNLVDTSHYNAYVLWTSMEPSWQQQKPYRRSLFIEEVGEMLGTEEQEAVPLLHGQKSWQHLLQMWEIHMQGRDHSLSMCSPCST